MAFGCLVFVVVGIAVFVHGVVIGEGAGILVGAVTAVFFGFMAFIHGTGRTPPPGTHY